LFDQKFQRLSGRLRPVEGLLMNGDTAMLLLTRKNRRSRMSIVCPSQTARRFKLVPLILLVWYFFCVVCPDRLAAAPLEKKLPIAEEGARPCDHGEDATPASECQQWFREHMPSQSADALQKASALSTPVVFDSPLVDPKLSFRSSLAEHPPGFASSSTPLPLRLRI
jgi:hypothetical protein